MSERYTKRCAACAADAFAVDATQQQCLHLLAARAATAASSISAAGAAAKKKAAN